MSKHLYRNIPKGNVRSNELMFKKPARELQIKQQMQTINSIKSHNDLTKSQNLQQINHAGQDNKKVDVLQEGVILFSGH